MADCERVAVLGASGSGKTTLLDLVAGILAPASGAVTVAGQDLSRLPGGGRRRFRITRIGLIFQAFELLEQVASHGATLVMVTHDHDLLDTFDRVLDMRDFHASASP